MVALGLALVPFNLEGFGVLVVLLGGRLRVGVGLGAQWVRGVLVGPVLQLVFVLAFPVAGLGVGVGGGRLLFIFLADHYERVVICWVSCLGDDGFWEDEILFFGLLFWVGCGITGDQLFFVPIGWRVSVGVGFFFLLDFCSGLFGIVLIFLRLLALGGIVGGVAGLRLLGWEGGVILRSLVVWWGL